MRTINAVIDTAEIVTSSDLGHMPDDEVLNYIPQVSAALGFDEIPARAE